MSVTSIAILGGDLRQCYLAEYLHTMGHEVYCLGTLPFPGSDHSMFPEVLTLTEALVSARLVVGPIPFTAQDGSLNTSSSVPIKIYPEELTSFLCPGQILIGGLIPKSIREACARKQITCFDLMEEENLTLANAALTAEGLLAHLIDSTPFSLTGQKALLIGFGRCGQEIAKHLVCFDMELSTLEKDPSRLLKARMEGITALDTPSFPTWDYDLIINTVPEQVLTAGQLGLLPKHCTLFDIASAPYGFAFEAAQEQGLALFRCPGIPGRMMPKTAGEMIGKIITERMLSHGFS